jgi:hypothetical protein
VSDDEGTISVRSFRVCFDLERRIHKIDRWRIPLPYGLPLRSLAYFGATLVAVLVLSQLPIVGALLGALHPAIRFILLPAGAAYALTQWRIDGRLPHAAGLAWLRMRLDPPRVSAFRAAAPIGRTELGTVTLARDERGARMRRGVVEGPARIVLRYPATMRARGRALHVAQQEGRPMWRGKQINLREDQKVVVQ